MSDFRKVCKNCHTEKWINEFPLCRNSRGNICRVCRNRLSYDKIKSNPESYKKKVESNNRYYRNNPSTKQIQGYKASDKRHGRENDLDIDYLRELISKGCTYCGSKDKVGLDRLDNTLGHTKNNVVPCCSRCNYLKRDMPFAAWVYFVPAIKLANHNNAFGNWNFNLKKAA